MSRDGVNLAGEVQPGGVTLEQAFAACKAQHGWVRCVEFKWTVKHGWTFKVGGQSDD